MMGNTRFGLLATRETSKKRVKSAFCTDSQDSSQQQEYLLFLESLVFMFCSDERCGKVENGG